MLLLLFSFFELPLHAKSFQNSYIRFELPARWQCNMQQTEWICRSSETQASKEAIIILTAKQVGPMDTLSQYDQYLRKPKVAVNSAGKSQKSELKQIQRRKVKNHEWVDALLLGSEIPNFYTRYLATTKSKIAILVTFTAHQRYYTKYSKDFFRAIQSLEVIANDSLIGRSSTIQTGPDGSILSRGFEGLIPEDMLAEEECLGEACFEEASAPMDILDYALILVVMIFALGAYLVLKK